MTTKDLIKLALENGFSYHVAWYEMEGVFFLRLYDNHGEITAYVDANDLISLGIEVPTQEVPT